MKNSAVRNCCISARGAIKLHPFGTSVERSEACMPKGVQFYCTSSTYTASKCEMKSDDELLDVFQHPIL